MDVTHLLEKLNERQREAVCAPPGNVLVLAGAGCGKTGVLTRRVAWLIRTQGVSPFGILAVTFTNKAAREMRSRIETLLGMPAEGMWVGTFHGIAHRLLRQHWHEAGLPQSFQILDSDDQYRMIRRVLRELQLDESRWPPRQAQWFINGRKDEGLRAADIDAGGDPVTAQLQRIYGAYEEACRRGGVVDFAELLLRAHELLRDRPDLLAHYQHRFSHILVDEFQDTNTIQYAWIRLLAGGRGRVFVVGDDDQSIYGWRGARVENIHRFQRDFPDVALIRLEQNYRSTGTILSAANAVIARNADRLGKELWTAGSEGEPVRIYSAFNELEEARFVVERIRDWVEEGNRRSEVAILYRSNAQSRVLEEALMHAGMPYRVYGGLRFFERAEIKDALAYLRLIANPDDDPSFERVVNTPTRGIGERTIQTVREHAAARHLSLWRAALDLIDTAALAARALKALAGFLNQIERLRAETETFELHDTVQHAIDGSGLVEHYQKEKGERGQARIENLEELVNAARQFEFDEAQLEGTDPLSAFLAHAALEAGEGQADEWEDSVQLMTLHSAKGLEFPLVFLCGLEEGLFPHQMSISEPGRLEEERRLAYVGMTRAMRRLYITYAEVRRLYGQENYTRPSRFIAEIPLELTETIRLRGGVGLPGAAASVPMPTATTAPGAPFRLGQRVLHGKFGEGVVIACEGQGAQTRIHVNFDAVGTKILMLSYANLQSL